MFGFIKNLFGTKPAAVTAPVVDTKVEAANSAPYKVEEPTSVAVQAVVESIAPAKKPAAKKQQFAKKAPAAKKPATNAPAKKPAARKPKAKPAA